MKTISQELLTEDKVVSSTYIDTMYQIDSETAVRLWKFETNEEKIVQEKKNARNTLVLGIPAAISFEMVKVGDQCGVIYEKLQSKTLGELLMENPDQFDKYVADFTDLAHLMHRTHVSPDDFTSVRSELEACFNTQESADLFMPEEIAAARRMIAAVPDGDVYLNMHFHPRTLRYVDGELTTYEMISTGWGHPAFDIAATAAQTHLLTVIDQSGVMTHSLINMDVATTEKFWKAYVRSYFDCKTEEEYAKMEKLMAFAGWLRFVTYFPGITRRYSEKQLGIIQDVCKKNFFPFIDQWITDMKGVWPVFEKINQ